MQNQFQRVALAALVALLVTSSMTASAQADAPSLTHTRLTGGARLGDDVQEYYLDALVPFRSCEHQAWFLDLRGMLLEDIEQELNAGLVGRRLVSERKGIVGANLFYDTRWTENDSVFDQVGAGVEWLSPWVDARANYYYPLGDAKALSDSAETDVTRSGSTRTTTTSLIRTYEEALEGYDAEIGVWLPGFAKRIPTGVFVGYYDFKSDVVDNMNGMKVRLESRLHRNVVLDAEWFEDEALNRTDYLVGLRLSFDFGGKGTSHSAVRPFATRMNDMVQRDFRIRTITTGPVVYDTVSAEQTVSSRRSDPEKPPPPPTCYLDSEGEVACD